MVWTNREINEKIERINELKEKGLNTPRMFYLKKFANPDDLMKAFEWAAKIHYESPNQIFNIRTYNYSKEIETSQTEHFTDIPFDDLEDIVLDINLRYVCMIDAETPDNGRLAGTIVIEDIKSPTGRVMNSKVTIEYCEKKCRAMVRESDKFAYAEIINNNILADDNLQSQLMLVIMKAMKFNHDKILEWTWFCNLAGELGENLVWWESRRM